MWEPWHGSSSFTQQLLLLLQLILVMMLASPCFLMGNADQNGTATAPPQTVGIGGLLSYNSTIGRAAKASLELAVEEVNNAGLLGNATLVLHLGNTNCSAFQGAAAGKTKKPKNSTHPSRLHLNIPNVKKLCTQNEMLALKGSSCVLFRSWANSIAIHTEGDDLLLRI